MKTTTKVLRHFNYYLTFYARLVGCAIVWKYAGPLYAVAGLLAVEVVLWGLWMVRRFRALRKAGRLATPIWETRVLRGARAAVEISHDVDDVKTIVGYRSTWFAVLLTVWQAVSWVARIVGTLVKHRAVDLIRVAETRRLWDRALTSKKVGLTEGKEKRVPYLSEPRTNIDLDIEAYVKPGRLGFVVQDIADVSGRIAEVVGCRQVSVTPGEKVGVGLLHFYWTDPLARHLGIVDLPVEKHAGTVAYGIRRNQEAATIDLDKSLLIGGLTGTGKSSLMWALWASIIRSGVHVRLWVSDPKGGMELDALEKMLNVLQGPFQISRYVRNAAETTTMVNAFEKELRVRQGALKAAGIRKHRPTAEFPQMILILDELLPLVEMLKKGTASTFGQILFEGRAAGFTCWANTQVGHADSLGTNRNLFPTRVCLGMPTSQATDTILGDQSESRGATCSLLGKNVKKNAGLGWSIDESGRLAPFRVAYVDDRVRGDGSKSDIDWIAGGALPPGMVTEHTEVEALKVGVAKQSAVYRVYGPVPGSKGMSLIYVGKSNQPGIRFDQHRDRDFVKECPLCEDHGPCKWWAVHVDPFRDDAERCPAPVWYPNEETALKVEKAAIVAECPLMNTVHNGGNRWQRQVHAKIRGGKARRFAARARVEAPAPVAVPPVKKPRTSKPPKARTRPEKVARVARPAKKATEPRTGRWRAVSKPLAGNPLSPSTASTREPTNEELQQMSIAQRNALMDGVGFGAE